MAHAVEQEASDLILTVEVPPVIRLHGELLRLPGARLSPHDTQAMTVRIMTDYQRDRVESEGQVDFAYSLTGVGRFRVNVFRQRGSYAAALRIIPPAIRSLAELNMPTVLADLSRHRRGLVLVTGTTGCGKTSTLAAMIDLINAERACHIVTLEDPIEYLHRHNQAVVNQREVGYDTTSFAAGLRAALRESPDVILVGEMRDQETIATALTAAETGHLVFGTLHTGDAPQTVDRIVSVFPPHQQEQIRIQLASTLQGVVTQELVPRCDVKGRIPAVEVLIGTTAVRNLVREGKTHQLPSAIQTGGRSGMRSFDSSLRELVARGAIKEQEATARNRAYSIVEGGFS
ncbi:MAG: type IV pilus twitching motility protein PilT [Bacillota bacterium]